MAGYMPQDLFEMGAVTVAKLHLAEGKDIDDTSAAFFRSYSADYVDDDVAADWARAAADIVKILRASFPEADDHTLAASCTQLQYCIKNYNPDGSRRKRRLLGGTLFNRLRQSNPGRVDDCQRDIAAYSVGTLMGRFPIAPRGWSL